MTIEIADRVCDFGLSVLAETDTLCICSAPPHSYDEATSTYALGAKQMAPGAVFSLPGPGTPEGRTVSSTAFTDGVVTSQGTATRWAAVDQVNARLLATGTLANPIDVHPGQKFSLSTMSITMVGTLTTIALRPLLAASLASGAPIMGSPQFSYAQKNLIASGLLAGTPLMPTPVFRLSNILSGIGLVGSAPTVGSPEIRVIYKMTAGALLDAAPLLDAPQMRQSHTLNGVGLSSGVPSVGNPAFGQKGSLVGTSLLSGTPTLGAPLMRLKAALAPAGLNVTAPTLGNPLLQHIIPFNVILSAASFTSLKPVLPSTPVVTLNP